MNYDERAADEFWSRRVHETDELAAVLNYGVPRFVNEAHSKWEVTCVLSALPDIAERRVLDLACGNGRVTVPLARLSAHVTAVDNAQGMLQACKENVQRSGLAARVTFNHASATHLPFADGEFDVALCLGLLEHLLPEPRQAALHELVRVSRAGGIVLCTANNDQSLLLKRRPVYQRAEQHLDGKLKGFFSGMVGKEWVEELLQQDGMTTEVIATNTFQAFALHLRRETQSSKDQDALWRLLFDTCAELDIRYRVKGDLDKLFADQFVIRAVKIYGGRP